MLEGYLDVGFTRRGKHVRIAPDERKYNVHVVGLPGSGKSALLQQMVQDDIKRGQGLVLLDPHGELYDDLVAWCAMQPDLDPSRIRLFDPVDPNFRIAFNPLYVHGLHEMPLEERAAALASAATRVTDAICQVWGGAAMDAMPRLEGGLLATFYLLAEHHLTLAEGRELLRIDNTDLRQYLSQHISNALYETEWKDITGYLRSPKPFKEEFESTLRRIRRILDSPYLQSIIGQSENSIDFFDVMERGEVVLINLADRGDLFSDRHAQVIGRIIVNDIVAKAQRRKPGQWEKLFTLYIDECYQYVGRDIDKLLNQRRKNGLCAVLAHQYYSQLEDSGDEYVAKAVMNSARNKIIFECSPEDALIWAERINHGRLDLQKFKEKVGSYQVTDDEVEIWQTVSDTETESITYPGETSGETTTTDPEGEDIASTVSSTKSEPTVTKGRSRTVAQTPMLRSKREWISSQVYTMDELIYNHSVGLTQLDQREAVVKLHKQAPCRITTSLLDPLPERSERAAIVKPFKRRSLHAWRSAVLAADVRLEIDRRNDVLQRGLSVHLEPEEEY